MNKSESIKAGLRKGFQSRESKLAKRKCYGYKPGANGELVIDPEEAKIVNRIFTQYQSGMSLGAIAAELSKQQVPSPTEKRNEARRQSTSCCPMKNIQAGSCFRKQSAPAVCR